MSKTLAEPLGYDTISRFVKSAPLRLEEGDVLSKDYRLAAIYLYGYAAEMILKAAYFKNLRYPVIAEIDRDTRKRAGFVAELQGFMKRREPHNIAGWARLLVWDKMTLHTPAYEPTLSREIVAKAETVYQNWRPEMRYRNTSPNGATVAIGRSAVACLVANYSRM
jgi:hypothetical protein